MEASHRRTGRSMPPQRRAHRCCGRHPARSRRRSRTALRRHTLRLLPGKLAMAQLLTVVLRRFFASITSAICMTPKLRHDANAEKSILGRTGTLPQCFGTGCVRLVADPLFVLGSCRCFCFAVPTGSSAQQQYGGQATYGAGQPQAYSMPAQTRAPYSDVTVWGSLDSLAGSVAPGPLHKQLCMQACTHARLKPQPYRLYQT